jgi:lysozyme
MRISDQGLELLMEREGKRNEAYRDTRGIWTIGVGHTGPEVHAGLVWTDQQVMDTLRKDLAWVESALDLVTVELQQYQHDALCSFVFNIGYGAFSGSTMLRLINIRAFDAAAQQFDRWHIPPEIIPRRNAEKEQFKGTQFVARIEGA